MRQTDSLPELELPEFSYGSVWLVGAGNGDPRHLSPLAVHALRTADAVIHDLGVPRALLDLVKPSHYREAGSPYWAIGRAIRLAQDGWRVVHLVEGDTVERAMICAIRCAENEIPFRIVPGAGLLVATPQSEAAGSAKRRLPPLGFSMSGLAG
jgi:uroporphyrin-III C-methyltransferase